MWSGFRSAPNDENSCKTSVRFGGVSAVGMLFNPLAAPRTRWGKHASARRTKTRRKRMGGLIDCTYAQSCIRHLRSATLKSPVYLGSFSSRNVATTKVENIIVG